MREVLISDIMNEHKKYWMERMITLSLLSAQINEPMKKLAQQIFEAHFERDPKLHEEYDDHRKMLMYDDILYNMGYLETAMRFDDSKIFTDYAVWLYQLLCHLMKDIGRERLKDQMVDHYQILKQTLSHVLPSETGIQLAGFIDAAIEVTEKESLNFQKNLRFHSGRHIDIRHQYLYRLMENDTRGAIDVIRKAADEGIEMEEIYLDVLQEVMVEVGDLWHRNEISVDREHYCTSTTQVALSQFYPRIFSKPRNGYKILTCCVGSELHEMGVRMVSDLFEYHGWDSVYLGAAVPVESIINAIREHRPDLVGLSVTMPHYLGLCHEVTVAIRKEFPYLKIAVGGRAFQMTSDVWRKWDVDIYTENASLLLEWATKTILFKGDVKV